MGVKRICIDTTQRSWLRFGPKPVPLDQPSALIDGLEIIEL